MRLGWLAGLTGAAAAPLGWGLFEAGWLRIRRLEVSVPALDEQLAGLRIVHLSDFHLGMPSRGERAVERAVEWAASTDADLIVITGDLVSRPQGEQKLKKLLQRLGPPTYAVLGNHDVEHSRDPFSRAAGLLDLSPARLLVDEADTIELRGRQVQVVGVDPRSFRKGLSRPDGLVDPAADLRILLCHFPRVLDYLGRGAFQLVLAGHMHVSPGLGTTLVPLRFFARPEATELVLQPA